MKDKKTKPKKKNSSDKESKERLQKNILDTTGILAEIEFHFLKDDLDRNHSFDLAIPEHMVAIEIEGGSWSNGRHTRGSGFIKDMWKYNEATRRGWKLVRLTPQQIDDSYITNLIESLIWKET